MLKVKKCLEADEVQLLYYYFLNAYFLYNVIFSRKKLTCVYGVGGARSLSGSQGGGSLKKFENP